MRGKGEGRGMGGEGNGKEGEGSGEEGKGGDGRTSPLQILDPPLTSDKVYERITLLTMLCLIAVLTNTLTLDLPAL